MIAADPGTEAGQGAEVAAMPVWVTPGPALPIAPAAAQLGLLVQAAQAQQAAADRSLARLETHAEGLDQVVRDQIRRSFIAECGELLEEAGRAAEALGRLRGVVLRHFTAMGLVLAALPAAVAVGLLWRYLPTAAELAALRTQRAQLLLSIAQLHAAGGHVELRHCGQARRLCVHIDRRAPAYGEAADYLIVKGY